MKRVEKARTHLVNREDATKGGVDQNADGKHGGIHGLAVAGASGLLALVYPEEFGTVDVMVTKALHLVGLPEVAKVNPKNISIPEAECMIEIMLLKALELNRRFGTNKWTPRLVDRVLWVSGH
jgi:hypothetical protein